MVRQNGITIEDMMQMECMKKSKVIAGLKGIRNVISRVNVMADPDILNWVDSGEFLLTTAYSFKKDNIEEQKKLIKECYKKGLSGIGIKIHPYLESLSQEVKDLADVLNFPIIDLYYATPFSDIMTPIFKEIFNKQADLLQRMERIHEQFLDLMLSGANIGEIAEVVHENIKNPLLIKLEFPEKQIVKFNSIEDTVKGALVNNVEKFFAPNLNKSKERKLHESTELIEGKYISRMVMPIVIKNNIYGYIFAWAVNTPLGGFDLSVIESASTTIALEVLKKLSVKEVENRYRAEFLDDLISLEEKRKEKAIERSAMFNLGSEDKYMVMVINIKGNENKKFKKVDQAVDSMQQNISKIVHFVERQIEECEIAGIVAGKTDSIQIVLSFRKDKSIRSVISEFSSNTERMLISKFSNLDYKMGIGRLYNGIRSVSKSYYDAIEAISAGEILGDEKVIHFDSLGIYKILCQDHLKDELESFYKTTLEPLVEYDNRKSTELVKTLEAYFEYNGNLKKMADALYTHYNTVLYRISRIKEITNIDFENAKDRLNLEIALKIKQLIKK
jgi:PucR family transcriptional regulator, purine catabolism regulatory protein